MNRRQEQGSLVCSHVRQLLLLPLLILHATSSHAREVCGFLPTSYSYLRDSFTSTASAGNCTQVERESRVYLNCPPSILNDGNIGPENFSESDLQSVYVWNNDDLEDQQMLFTFARNITLTQIKVFHYFFDGGRPKVRLFVVDDDFQVWDEVDMQDLSSTINRETEGGNERRMAIVDVTGRTSKILMFIQGDKRFRLVISEIQFCINDTSTPAVSTHPDMTVTTRLTQHPTQQVYTDVDTQGSTSGNILTTTAPATSSSRNRLLEGLVSAVVAIFVAAVLAITAVIIKVIYSRHKKNSHGYGTDDIDLIYETKEDNSV